MIASLTLDGSYLRRKNRYSLRCIGTMDVDPDLRCLILGGTSPSGVTTAPSIIIVSAATPSQAIPSLGEW